MTNCLFCDELESKSANVFHTSQSRLFAARWDNFPVRPGHVEIVPTYHVERVEEMSRRQLQEFKPYVSEVMWFIQSKSVDLIEVYTRMSENPVNDIAAELVQRALRQLRRVKGKPQGFTTGINDGPVAGQTVPHVHEHLIPRWPGDVPRPEGGLRNMFPDDLYAR